MSREYRLADCGNTDPKAECPTDQLGEGRRRDPGQGDAGGAAHLVLRDGRGPAAGRHGSAGHEPAHDEPDGRGAAGGQERGKAGEKIAWWWTPTHVDLRDEKAVLFATSLDPGTYQFTYSIRASLPGTFLILPVTASQMYFPEVWGRGAGGEFVVTE